MKALYLTCLAICGSAVAAEITIDPAGASLSPGPGITLVSDNNWTTATSAWNKTEWETAGNLESWTATNVSATVSGGSLSGTSSSADPQLRLVSITGGPDLDVGYNDFVELRLQLPSTYTGDIEIFFGVANAFHVTGAAQTGFNSARSVTIPNAKIPKDGGFHTYRIDMGLVQMWRGRLTDLRIDPATVSGTPFALDYVRIGDAPGNDYQKRVSNACPDAGEVRQIENSSGVMKTHTIRSMESKRFRIIYSDVTLTEDPGVPWSDEKARFTLRNLEECWQNHVKRLGYKDPTLATGTTSGTRYKTNMTMIHLGGTWAGVDNDDPLFRGGYGWQNTYPAATAPNPPSWVTPHEFMHVCQFHQGGNYGNAATGKWFEAHADYGEETTLAAYPEIFGSVSGLNEQYMSYRFLYATNPFSHYRVWPVFLHLDQNPDGNIPNSKPGTNLSARLWQESLPDEYIYGTIDRITKADGGTGVKDIIGGLARRDAIYDYGDRKAPMQAAAASWDADNKKRLEYSPLVSRPDDPSWLQIPAEIAPQPFAYTIHDLVPNTLNAAGRVVAVNFRGLPNPDRQADWRASLVVVNDAGNARYSPLWNNGVSSVTLAADENRVYLSVAATPGEITSPVFEDTNQSYKSDPAKTRFPYEVQLTGASVRETGGGSTAGLVQHANGGGWKSSTATVASTAYIGPNARVLDTATVSGNARIEDFAVVKGTAKIQENAVVSGHAVVRGKVTVRGFAKIREYALVSSADWQAGVVIEGNARIGGRRSVIDEFTATDNAMLKGVGYAYQAYSARGDVIIDGDALGNAHLTSGAHTGWLWDDQVPARAATMPALSRLFAAYEFPTAHPHSAIDKYGVTDAPLVGSPTWVSSDGTRSGFLSFNGSGQRALLSRWLNDVREFTVTAQVKWSGTGASNQPVFHIGDGTTAKRLSVTPSNASGVCALVISHGGTTYTVAAASAMPSNTWTNVAVTLDGGTATLYLNGVLAGSTACPVRPENLLPADTNQTPAHNFLAAGTSLPDFQGSIDDFKVYSTALAGLTGVGVSPVTATLSEVGDPISLTFSRNVLDNAVLANALTVSYTVSGSALPGVDFSGLAASGTVTIPAGQTSVNVQVSALTDNLTEGTESFTVTVVPGADYGVTSPTATISMPDRVPLDQDLLARYLFDETSGSTANDSSGNNNHADLFNGPTWNAGALSFDGVDDYVQTPVPNGGERTLSAWIHPRTSSTSEPFESVFDTDIPGQYGTGWGVKDGKIEVILDDQFWSTGVSITHNVWQHVSLTFDAAQARLYVNGELAASLNYSRGGITDATYKIGRSNANAAFFDGQIRDARIYSRPIYSIEAMEIYQANAPDKAPRNLSAIAGHGSVTLGWQPADAGETSYLVRRSTTSGGPYTTISSNITGSSHVDDTAANGTTYFYVVAAVANGSPGPNSNEATATPSAGTALPPPWLHGNIGSAAGSPATVFSGGQITMSGAGRSISGSNGTIGGSISTDNFRFLYLPVVGDCTITAQITSFTGTPDIRAGVMLRQSTAGGSIHASALWNHNATTSRRGLFVYRATASTSSSANTVTSFSPTQPWLRVSRVGTLFTAYYSSDGSAWTQIGTTQTLNMTASGSYLAGLAVCSSSTTALATAVFSNVTITGGYPTGLSATAGNQEVALSWNSVAGATSYRVKRATVAGGPYTLVNSPTTNSFTDTGRTNGTTYYYVVSAHNGTAESADSSQVFATPAAPQASVPANLTATDLGTSIDLTWSASTNATGYRVKRALSPAGPFTLLGSPTGTTFSDSTVASGVNYFYVVAAVNSSNEESGDSPVVSVVRSLYFDPNGATAGSVSDGGNHAWLSSNWALAPGGTLASAAWQSGKQAIFAATSPAAPLAYSIDLGGFDTGSHGNFTGIRALAGTVNFTGNVSNFYLTTPAAITADPGAAIVFQQTRSAADVLAFNLNGQPATFHGDITLNTAGIGNGGSIIVDSGTLKLGNAIANLSPASITVQQGATLLNDGAAGKYFNLSQLTLNGGTLAATNAGDFSRGNFVLTAGLVTGGNTTSLIFADVRSNGGSDQTLNVADTPETIDLLFSGKLGHFNNVAWSYATKTGPGTMKLSGANELGGLTVSDGKLILEGAGAIALMNVNSLRNNAQVEISIPTGTVSYTDRPFYGSGSYAKTGPGVFNLQSFSDAPSVVVENGRLHMSGGHNNFWAVTATTVRSGAVLSNNTHSHIKGLILDGGELASSGVDATWGGWMLDQTVTVTGSGRSIISAQRVAIANASNVSRIFDVAASANLDVTGTFEDANTTTANGLTKTGLGAMTLSGANTYSGPTSVNQGTLLVTGSTAPASSLTVSENATLGGSGTIHGPITINPNGTLAPGTSIGTLNAASSVALNGRLAIEVNETTADRLNVASNLNITNATLAITGTLSASEYLIATYGTRTGSSFANVTGLPSGYVVDYSNNQIRLVVAPVNPTFTSWIGDNYPSLSDKTANGDPDSDGIPNALEYVLGGDPSHFDASVAPTVTISGGNLVFTFQRADASETADISLVVESGADLSTWPETYPISPGSPSPAVSIQENASAPDSITVSVPGNGNIAKFARLRVIVTP